MGVGEVTVCFSLPPAVGGGGGCPRTYFPGPYDRNNSFLLMACALYPLMNEKGSLSPKRDLAASNFITGYEVLLYSEFERPICLHRNSSFPASELWVVHPAVLPLPSIAAIFSGPLNHEVRDFATAPLVSQASSLCLRGPGGEPRYGSSGAREQGQEIAEP